MRSLLGLSLGLLIPAVALADDVTDRDAIEARITYYAKTYSVPVELLRKVVRTESTFNPAARNGPYWGLMQILPKTAEGLGYRGSPKGLLDAETNLIYGGAYLANAYIIAGGNSERAHSLFKTGYYYEAKRKRLLSKLIKVPMGTTPVLVAGKIVTRPSDKTMLALATPEPTSPVVAKAAAAKLVLAEGAKPDLAKPEIAKPDVADVVVASADVAAMPKPIPRPVAKPVVEMAEIIVPLLPRARPAAPVQTAALVEPAKPQVRGLLYATALVPPSKVIRPDYAEQMVARPELALASASSRFASDATAVAFAPGNVGSKNSTLRHPMAALPAASRLPAAVRIAATDDGIRSDAPGCCRMDTPAAIAMPLPRIRPTLHKPD